MGSEYSLVYTYFHIFHLNSSGVVLSMLENDLKLVETSNNHITMKTGSQFLSFITTFFDCVKDCSLESLIELVSLRL